MTTRTAIIQHRSTGDCFTAQLNSDDQIVAISVPMHYSDVDACNHYQDLIPCEPIDMDEYRLITPAVSA